MNKPTKSVSTSSDVTGPASGEREQLIARAAYLRAEKRGFQGGDPVADWLDAEAEIDAMLARQAREAPREPQPKATTGARRAESAAPRGAAKSATGRGTGEETAVERAGEAKARKPSTTTSSSPAGAAAAKPLRRSASARTSDTQTSPSGEADQERANLEAQLNAGRADLDKLRPKLSKLKADARKEVERELAKLDTLRDRLATKAEAAWQKSGKRREALKQQAEKILQEFKAGLERLGSRFER